MLLVQLKEHVLALGASSSVQSCVDAEHLRGVLEAVVEQLLDQLLVERNLQRPVDRLLKALLLGGCRRRCSQCVY